MPHQPRRKTLSPSQATTFLSAANLQDNFDPMSLPDPPSYSKSPVPRENDENRTNGQITRTPIPDPATPIDKVDEDVDAMLSANDSLSPPPMLSPLGGGDDGTPGKRHKKKSRKGKRNKKRMSICMPSENPEISGVLATEVSGMRPLTDDDQEAGAASELPKVSTEELPGLLNEAITKFCDMGESKHSTKEAAEVAEFVKFHSEYPLLSKRQIKIGKSGGGESLTSDDDASSGKGSHRGPTLLEKQQVLMSLAPSFKHMESAKKESTEATKKATGCICVRIDYGYCYEDAETGEEIDCEEYSKRYRNMLKAERAERQDVVEEKEDDVVMKVGEEAVIREEYEAEEDEEDEEDEVVFKEVSIEGEGPVAERKPFEEQEPVEEKEWSEEDFMVSVGDAEEEVEDEPTEKEDEEEAEEDDITDLMKSDSNDVEAEEDYKENESQATNGTKGEEEIEISQAVSPNTATTTHRGRRFSSPPAEASSATKEKGSNSEVDQVTVLPTPPKHVPLSPKVLEAETEAKREIEVVDQQTAESLLKEEETKLWTAIDSVLLDYVKAVKEIRERAGSNFQEKKQGAKNLVEFLASSRA